jgi:hypothetical protein
LEHPVRGEVIKEAVRQVARRYFVGVIFIRVVLRKVTKSGQISVRVINWNLRVSQGFFAP